MGFFSWECKHCGKSIRSPYSVSEFTSWMNDAVLIEADGSIIKGSYDGYGRLETKGGTIIEFSEHTMEPCLYHQKCWIAAGKPIDYSPSEGAGDQGYFIDLDASEQVFYAVADAIRLATARREKEIEHIKNFYKKVEPSEGTLADATREYDDMIKFATEIKNDIINGKIKITRVE